jgi:hypothetical protein
MLTAETSNTGYLFINEASVRAGPEEDCLWRQVYEYASLTQVRADGKTDHKELGENDWVPATDSHSDKYGDDGTPQDWRPLVTAIERYLDAHYFLRKKGIVSVDYVVQFLLQATVPMDLKFSSNAVICRRWSIRWSMHNLGPGQLMVMVGPMAKGQAACKPS